MQRGYRWLNENRRMKVGEREWALCKEMGAREGKYFEVHFYAYPIVAV